MAARMLARAIFMRRQRDGLADGFVGVRGGRFRDLPGDLFSKQGSDQSRVDPRLCEFGLLSGQPGEASEALHPFKGKFDLPAEAIKGEHVSSRESLCRQRSQEEDVLRRLETARVEFLAALLGGLEQALLLGFRLFRVLASDDEAQYQRFRRWGACRAFVDKDLHFTFLFRLSGESSKQVKTPVVLRVQEAQRVPAGTHDEVRAGVDYRPQIARLCIIAVTQRDIARLISQALQVFGTAP